MQAAETGMTANNEKPRQLPTKSKGPQVLSGCPGPAPGPAIPAHIMSDSQISVCMVVPPSSCSCPSEYICVQETGLW